MSWGTNLAGMFCLSGVYVGRLPDGGPAGATGGES
jgi:hypothetical protein